MTIQEKAIEWFTLLKEKFIGTEYSMYLDIAIQALKQTKWIPVSERLPEPSTAVLLHVKYKSSGQWTYQLGMWNDRRKAWEDWRTPYSLEYDFEIVEWMELPERYEEDNHE